MAYKIIKKKGNNKQQQGKKKTASYSIGVISSDIFELFLSMTTQYRSIVVGGSALYPKQLLLHIHVTYLPELGSNLVTTLACLYVNNFSHLDFGFASANLSVYYDNGNESTISKLQQALSYPVSTVRCANRSAQIVKSVTAFIIFVDDFTVQTHCVKRNVLLFIFKTN